jgi:NADH:ubiquinone oxidoreductase subunit D
VREWFIIVLGMVLTFGPGHPATHGVLRLLVELSFEVIVKVDVHIGLLHRSTEKLMEVKSVVHSIPYFDRMDYMSCYAQEDAAVSSISMYLELDLS